MEDQDITFGVDDLSKKPVRKHTLPRRGEKRKLPKVRLGIEDAWQRLDRGERPA